MLLLGTSMDNESAESCEKGSWDPKTNLTHFLEKDFVVDEVWRGMVARLGFSGIIPKETLSFWDTTLKEVYSSEEGRKKMRIALLNLI